MEEKTSTRLSLFSLCRVMEAISTTIKVINVGYFLLEERLLSIPFINFIKGILLYWKKNCKSNLKKTKDTIYGNL